MDAGTTCGATFTDATSWPVATTDPSSAVNTSSGSIRSSSSISRDRTWSTPGCAARRSIRLSLGPRWSSPGPRTAAASRSRRLVLVQVAGLHDQHGHGFGAHLGRRRRRERVEVGRVEAPALRPALAADTQVAREDGAGQVRLPDGGRGRSCSSRTPPVRAVRRRSAQAGQRRLDRASRVDHGHRRAVLGGGVDVAVDLVVADDLGRGGRDVLGRALGADQGRLDVRRPVRVVGRRRSRRCRRDSITSPGPTTTTAADADHRVAGGRLLEGGVRGPGAVVRRRQQDAASGARRGAWPVWNGPSKKPSALTVRVPPRRLEHELRVEREQRGRQVRRRVGVGDGAAHGPAVADLDVADGRQGVAQHAVVDRRRVHELGVRRERADGEAPVVEPLDAAELVEPADVDQRLRRTPAAA